MDHEQVIHGICQKHAPWNECSEGVYGVDKTEH